MLRFDDMVGEILFLAQKSEASLFPLIIFQRRLKNSRVYRGPSARFAMGGKIAASNNLERRGSRREMRVNSFSLLLQPRDRRVGL